MLELDLYLDEKGEGDIYLIYRIMDVGCLKGKEVQVQLVSSCLLQ